MCKEFYMQRKEAIKKHNIGQSYSENPEYEGERAPILQLPTLENELKMCGTCFGFIPVNSYLGTRKNLLGKQLQSIICATVPYNQTL